jgi:hypothetical protein
MAAVLAKELRERSSFFMAGRIFIALPCREMRKKQLNNAF